MREASDHTGAGTQCNNRDVEGQVVGVGIGAWGGGTENTEGTSRGAADVRGDGRGGDQLNLTEEAELGGGGGKRRANRLAHVTEDKSSRGTLSIDRGLEISRRNGHGARGVVAYNVACSWHKFIGIRSGANHGGGVVVLGRGGNLTDETLNGRHLIFRT